MTTTMDEQRFRATLGRYPTGVTAITAVSPDGTPIGMVVGTFTSVSIDPPLVAFMPMRTSSSYARLRGAASLCANVLSAEQEPICRAFAVKGADDKFADLDYVPSPAGNPIISGAVAWVEFTVQEIVEAGDHDIVLGRVTDMGEGADALPMLFLGGGYGGFSPHSRVIPAAADVMQQLRLADCARDDLQTVADRLGLECAAAAAVEDSVVRVASAGSSAHAGRPARVGLRLPFEAPMGALLVAWEDRAVQERWVRRSRPSADAEEVDAYVEGLSLVRRRGWTLSLQTSAFEELDASIAAHATTHERAFHAADMHTALEGPNAFAPAVDLASSADLRVRNVSVPVFVDGAVALYFSVFGFGERTSPKTLEETIATLEAAAERVTQRIVALNGGGAHD